VNTKDSNSSVTDGQVSIICQRWQDEIASRLPQNLEESAKEHGAIIRKRGIQDAAGLIKALFIYATSSLSFRMLALCASCLKISTMTDTAWRKKLRACVPWLVYLLITVLPVIKADKKIINKRNIHLIDASNVRQIGKNAIICRIHMSYNLNIGAMDEIIVTDHHTAEGFQHYTIQENDIYIADSGYGKANMLEYIVKKKADCIISMTPSHVILEDDKGERINMSEKLSKTVENKFDFHCYTKNNKKKIPVRIICSKIPEDKIEKIIKTKKRKSQKRQSKIKEETLIYAEWVILMTTLEDSNTIDDILDIYRSRWQIELLFKRIKQNFNLHSIRKASTSYAKALVLLLLIVWALVEKQLILAELYLINKKIEANRISAWVICSFFYQRLKEIINSMWTLLVDVFDDSNVMLEKYLIDHKCSRENQYSKYHFNSILDLFTKELSQSQKNNEKQSKVNLNHAKKDIISLNEVCQFECCASGF